MHPASAQQVQQHRLRLVAAVMRRRHRARAQPPRPPRRGGGSAPDAPPPRRRPRDGRRSESRRDRDRLKSSPSDSASAAACFASSPDSARSRWSTWTSSGSTPSDVASPPQRRRQRQRIAPAGKSDDRSRSPRWRSGHRARGPAGAARNPTGVCRRATRRVPPGGRGRGCDGRVGRGSVGFTWCRRVESNHRPRAYESLALPLSYVGKSWAKMVPRSASQRQIAPLRESARPTGSGEPRC